MRTGFLALMIATILGSENSISAMEWQTLKDEPSRADLFQQFIVPKNQGDQERAFELIGPFVFPADTTYDKRKMHHAPMRSLEEMSAIRKALASDLPSCGIRIAVLSTRRPPRVLDSRMASLPTIWAALGALPAEKKV